MQGPTVPAVRIYGTGGPGVMRLEERYTATPQEPPQSPEDLFAGMLMGDGCIEIKQRDALADARQAPGAGRVAAPPVRALCCPDQALIALSRFR